MNAPATTQRLDYLDAVRAFALLLGIVFHAGLSFLPTYIGWAVMDVSTSSIVANFTLISHSFRMELFFLMAGFFGRLTLNRRGAGSFVRSRLMRIGIPFIVGWFILYPLIISCWVMGGESLRGEVNILNGLKAGLQSLTSLTSPLFTGTHLWFLYYLLLISGITLLLRAIVSLTPTVRTRSVRVADAIVAWIARSPLSWFALTLTTAGCLWFMSGWGMDTPDRSLVPHLPVLVVYGGFFAFGWLLHRQPRLVERFARLTLARFVLCGTSIGISLLLSGYQADMGHPRIGTFRIGFVLSYAMMMWSLVALTIGLFKRFLDRPNRVVRYVADASYWLYLVHLPIVVWLQIAVAELTFHWSLKLPLISTLTVAIALVTYDLFVRSSLIGQTLNGKKRGRALFRSRRNVEVAPTQAAFDALRDGG